MVMSNKLGAGALVALALASSGCFWVTTKH